MKHEQRGSLVSWLRLARAYGAISAASEQLFRRHGLTTAQFDVIAQLGAAGALTQQELADRLLVTKGNISQLLARMADHGLIVRRAAGRSNLISLSEAGRDVHDRLVPLQEARLAQHFAVLTHAEQRTLAALLRRLQLSTPPADHD